jgi:hypothetical protein
VTFVEGEYVFQKRVEYRFGQYCDRAARVVKLTSKRVRIDSQPRVGGWFDKPAYVSPSSLRPLTETHWRVLKAVSSFGSQGAPMDTLAGVMYQVQELVDAGYMGQDKQVVWVGAHGHAALRWKAGQL